MADFDVFDMVGLAFDPPETNARQVKKKIDQKKLNSVPLLGVRLNRRIETLFKRKLIIWTVLQSKFFLQTGRN